MIWYRAPDSCFTEKIIDVLLFSVLSLFSLENIKNLGQIGDIVNVKIDYAGPWAMKGQVINS